MWWGYLYQGCVYLCEGTGVHRRGLDVKHHAVYKRFGTSYETDPQPETKTHRETTSHAGAVMHTTSPTQEHMWDI